MGAEWRHRGLASGQRTRRGRRARASAVRVPAARRLPPAQPLGPLRPPGRGARFSPALPSPPGPGIGSRARAGREPRDEPLRWVQSGRPGGGEAGRTSAWVCPADGPRIKMGRGRPGFEARLPACLSLGRWCPHSDTPPRPPPSPLGHSAPPTTCGHLTPLALCRLRTCPLGPVLPFSLQTGLPPSLTSSGPSSTKLDSVLWPSPSLFVVLYTCHFNSVHPLHHHAS